MNTSGKHQTTAVAARIIGRPWCLEEVWPGFAGSARPRGSFRTRHSPRWLKDLGYAAIEETVVNAHLGYASRLYRIPESFDGDWTCTLCRQRRRRKALSEWRLARSCSTVSTAARESKQSAVADGDR